MIVHARHRSLALAERHRRALARAHRADVTITARRTGRGHFSAHGQYFTFQITKKSLWDWIVIWERKRRDKNDPYVKKGQDSHTVGFDCQRFETQVSAIRASEHYVERTPKLWYLLRFPWDHKYGIQSHAPSTAARASVRLRS